jgi:PEP-CTERM motif
VTSVRVTNAGSNVERITDVIFPEATSGWLHVAETDSNLVDKVWLSGLDPNAPIIAIGCLNEVALVNPNTGDVEAPLLSGLDSPHDMDFVAAPEPSTWAMILLSFAGLAFARRRVGQAGGDPDKSGKNCECPLIARRRPQTGSLERKFAVGGSQSARAGCITL